MTEEVGFFLLYIHTASQTVFASNLFKLVIVYGIPRMGRNFDDCPDFQKNQGVGCRIMRNTESIII